MTKTELLQNLLDAFDNDKAAAVKAIQGYESKSFSSQVPPSITTGKVAIGLHLVSKTYKLRSSEVNVLKDISLNIYEGEFVAVTGASGSGKSTLLQLMGSLDKPSSGTVEIYGQDISKLSDKRLSRLRNTTIGFIFQFFYLQPFLKLDKNIEVSGMFGRMPPSDRHSRANETIEEVGLGDVKSHYPKQLSGGQLQRAAIGRALLNKPKIILADEPTGNLDSKNGEMIIEILENMRKLYNVTIILVTHDANLAGRADRVLTMKDGQIA